MASGREACHDARRTEDAVVFIADYWDNAVGDDE